MSDFVFERSYRGKVKAVILDWSGTLADAYVVAPAVVFVEVFARHGVEISMTEARAPMGLRKDLHIEQLTKDPAIAERWKKKHGKYPGAAEVKAMFADFVPMQLACLKQYSALLPGSAAVAKRLQKRGVKIGVTTGFTRAMVDILEKEAARQGFRPDSSVAGDEVEHGARPGPFMVYKNLDRLGVYPIQSVVKVDDTTSGVGEALNAGCWGVGVARYSNYMDMDTPDADRKMPKAELERRLEKTRAILRATGAHYVIDSIADLEPVIADIEARMARGERP
jgi:phosphonoacetaldehyde hydrolase